MSTSNINIRIDSQIKHEAQMVVGNQKKTPKLGGWEDKIWMSEDFDAPLDDFEEYMQ
jgi:hypothetical protein